MDELGSFPLVIGDRCGACGLCVQACQHGVLALGPEHALVAHPEECDYCGVCEELCPQNAIHCTFVIVWRDEERALRSANGGSSA